MVYDVLLGFTRSFSPGDITHFDNFYRADSLPPSPQKATACTLVTANRCSLGVYQTKCKPGATLADNVPGAFIPPEGP